MSTFAASRWILLTACLVLGLRPATDQLQADEPQGLISGTVVDPAGQPIAKAEVSAETGSDRLVVTTGPDGKFQFTAPKHASGRTYAALAAQTSDGRLGSLSVSQETPEPVTLMVKPGQRLLVTVQDQANQPIRGAEVICITNFRRIAGGSTDAMGNWHGFVPADLKDWSVVALKSDVGFDYATGLRGRGVIGDPHPLPDHVKLKLDGARRFKVKVLDHENRPVAGVRVGTWLVQKPGYEAELNTALSAFPSPLTGEDGLAVIDWLPAKVARSWSIKYVAENAYALDHAFFIPATDSREELTIHLLPIEELSGRVTHADGRPAAGITVRAQGKGAGMNDCRVAATTDADGRYKLRAYSEQAYVVAIADEDWAAPYRADVVVRAGQPTTGIDFVLTRPTRVHGRVTLGTSGGPVAKTTVTAAIDKGQIPAELRSKDDRIHRPIQMHFFAQTDGDGHYEIWLGPGDYRLGGPARTEPFKFTIPAGQNPTEIVHDFIMPRAETGSLTIRIVNQAGEPVPRALVSGSYASSRSPRLFSATAADAQGQLTVERALDPLVLHAQAPDRPLAGITRLDADAREATITVAPLAAATGRLLDKQDQPLAGKEILYAIRVWQGEPGRSPWMNSFGGTATTDADGRFSFQHLVPGERYDASIKIDEHSSRNVANLNPASAAPTELGDIRADPNPTKPYVPPTPAERAATAFTAKAQAELRQRLHDVLATCEREYMRPLILFGGPEDKACIELFRLFDERPTEDNGKSREKTPAELRWEFELLSLDSAQPEVQALATRLGLQIKSSEPVLAVLAADGSLAATYSLKLTGDKLAGQLLGRFLAESKLPTRDAQKMLRAGLDRAAAEDKRLFFIFSASWCGPCRLLSKFISEHKADLERHYVFVKLDISRDERAEELRQQYKEALSGGVPWFTILDSQGQRLVTSNDPSADTIETFGNPNIGFPSTSSGINHFLTMLQTTAPRLTADDLTRLRNSLSR